MPNLYLISSTSFTIILNFFRLLGRIILIQSICGGLQVCPGCAIPFSKTTVISRYLRGLMGTFNERAEKLMSKLTEVADEKTEAKMLHLVNCVTLDVIAKVLCQSVLRFPMQ